MHNRDEGFTLVEVVVSLALFAILAAAATTAIVGAIRAAHSTDLRVAAHLVAQQELDRIRELGAQADLATAFGYDAESDSFVTEHSADGRGFTAITTATPGWSTPCSLSGAEPYRDIEVAVDVESARIGTVYLDTRLACLGAVGETP